MNPLLFEQHLRATSPSPMESKPFLCDEDNEELAEKVTELLSTFGEVLDEDDDLSDSFATFCEYFEISASDAAYLENVLLESTRYAIGDDDIDEDDVKGFLASLNQPSPKPETTTAKVIGPTPRGTKAFLDQLKVLRYGDPYGNDDAFSAKNVKVFDREAHCYGHPYADFNSQKPTQIPLANPTLNVAQTLQARENAFEAVDSVGLGTKVHWRVVNRLTNEYVTKQIEKTQAESIARDLNNEYAAELGQLDESVTRKHFQAVANTVRQIEDPKKRQEFADHHASIFAAQNPRFDHKRFHEAAGTSYRGGKVQHNEGTRQSLPQTKLQEGLLTPLAANKVQAVEQALKRDNYTMAGSIGQSDHTPTPAREWKASRTLTNAKAEKFGEGQNVLNEHGSIRAVQQRNVRRPSQESFRLDGNGMDDKTFLNSINQQSLIPEKK